MLKKYHLLSSCFLLSSSLAILPFTLSCSYVDQSAISPSQEYAKAYDRVRSMVRFKKNLLSFKSVNDVNETNLKDILAIDLLQLNSSFLFGYTVTNLKIKNKNNEKGYCVLEFQLKKGNQIPSKSETIFLDGFLTTKQKEINDSIINDLNLKGINTSLFLKPININIAERAVPPNIKDLTLETLLTLTNSSELVEINKINSLQQPDAQQPKIIISNWTAPNVFNNVNQFGINFPIAQGYIQVKVETTTNNQKETKSLTPILVTLTGVNTELDSTSIANLLDLGWLNKADQINLKDLSTLKVADLPQLFNTNFNIDPSISWTNGNQVVVTPIEIQGTNLSDGFAKIKFKINNDAGGTAIKETYITTNIYGWKLDQAKL